MSKSMYEKVKNVMEYFGGRKVKNVSKNDHKVIVEYDDDEEPKFETMHPSEWESGATHEPLNGTRELQEWFVKRTTGLRTDLAKTIEKHNPRFSEVKNILDWVKEGFEQTYRNAIDKAFNLEDFMVNGRLDAVLKKLEEKNLNPLELMDGKVYFRGIPTSAFKLIDSDHVQVLFEKPNNKNEMLETVTYEEWAKHKTTKPDEVNEKLLDIIRHADLPLANLLNGVVFEAFKRQLTKLVDKSVSIVLEGTDETRRVNQIKDAYVGNSKEEQGK